MRTRKITLTITVAIVAIAATFLLITTFASAQVAMVASLQDAQAETAPQPATALSSLQAVSITFPPGDWPWYAQEEITVHPEPPIAEHPTELCAQVVNHDPVEPHIATLEFRVANFGIGVLFTPVGEVEVAVPPGGHAQGCVAWVPPEPGHWCIEVLSIQAGVPEPERSQRNIDVWEPLVPGMPHEMIFPVGPLPIPGMVTFTVGNLPPGWDVQLNPSAFFLMPGMIQQVALTTIPPVDAVLGSHMPIADVEGFLDGEPIGGFRKFDWPPVPLHRLKDPFFAESEIKVWPYPPRAGEPTQMCVELFNQSTMTQTVEVQFSWANFGIGLPFTPIGGPIVVEIPPRSHQTVCIWWVPPFEGHFCVQVQLDILGDIPYHTQFSQLNLDVAEPLRPGEPHAIEFEVGNFYNEFTNPNPVPTDIWLETDVHLHDWQVDVSPMVLPDMQPGEARLVTMIVTPPLELPPDGHPVVDVRALAEPAGIPYVIGGFRKVFRPPVPLHRFPDPPYAEREISVHPYPPEAGEPTAICVELYNPTPLPQTVEVLFSWANFGIGIPFTPINGLRPVTIPPHSMINECIHWIPPVSGHVCLQVELFQGNYPPQRSQRNIDIDEPLEPGVPHGRFIPVRNPHDRPMTITLGLIHHLPNWEITLSPDILPNVPAGGIQEVELIVIPPPGQPLPPDGEPIVDVEAFAEGELIGGFRKIFRPPVPIHRPHDPIYAESEIFVHPYPPRAHEPTELVVEVHNPTDESQIFTVTFSVASFGIGLPFTPVNDPIVVEVPPNGTVWPGTIWLPPVGGLWCIQVEIEIPGHDEIFFSQLNLDVGEPLEPNTPHSRPFPVRNPFGHPVTITLGLIPHFHDWVLELSDYDLINMAPDEVREVILTVTPPNDLPVDGDPIVDVEAFAEGELIGGFRKIFRPPVPVHRPKDPIYAESEIFVDPYPVVPGEPTLLGVEVFNPTDKDRVVEVTFSIAPFGIGLPFNTAHIVPNPIHIFVPRHGAARGHVIWQPPLWEGKFCVRVEIRMEGHEPIWSQRNIDVGEPLEPGQPHSLVFPVGGWPHTVPVSITLGFINHQDGWVVSLSPDELVNVQPGHPLSATLTVTPPLGVLLGTGDPIVDVEAFVEGELIGGFRKLDVPPIPIHKPHERGYAESEISIVPYPPQLGQESLVSTVVHNTSDETVTVELEFGWAKFGMGIPFTTTGMVPYTRSVTLAPATMSTASVTWTPTFSGHQCVRILLSDPDGVYEPQESQRNVEVVEEVPCGVPQNFSLIVYNDSSAAATVDIGTITYDVPDNWEVTVVPSATLELGAYSEGTIEVTVEIPCPLTLQGLSAARQVYALQRQAGGVPTIDVEGYIDGELVGGIEIQLWAEEQLTIYLPIVMKDWP